VTKNGPRRACVSFADPADHPVPGVLVEVAEGRFGHAVAEVGTPAPQHRIQFGAAGLQASDATPWTSARGPDRRWRPMPSSTGRCTPRGSVPNFAPAASPRVRRSSSSWPPTDLFKRLRSRPATLKRWSGVHCSPAHIRQVGAGVPLKGLYPLVPHVHLPVLLARPESSGSTDPSCRCQGCSHPHRRRPSQAALSFTRPLRRPSDGVLPPPFGNAAPRGGARRARCKHWPAPARCCR